MQAGTTLTQLALNQGRITRSPASAEAEEIVEQLRTLVADGAGPVPLFEGWFLDVRMLRADDGTPRGGAFFQLMEQPPPSSQPAIMAIACWTDADSDACWGQVDAIYRTLQSALAPLGLWRAPPRRAPMVPWVAAWLTQHATNADPAVLHALGAVERAVVWALAANSAER